MAVDTDLVVGSGARSTIRAVRATGADVRREAAGSGREIEPGPGTSGRRGSEAGGEGAHARGNAAREL